MWVSITAYGRHGAAAGRIGFGDDVAVAAGLVASDPGSGSPVFCGDALADPLTGIAAALLVLDGLAAGGGRLLDVPMAQVAAATLDGSGSRPAEPAGAGWRLPAGRRALPVRPPRARAVPAAPAPPAGADTEAVRSMLAARRAGGAA